MTNDSSCSSHSLFVASYLPSWSARATPIYKRGDQSIPSDFLIPPVDALPSTISRQYLRNTFVSLEVSSRTIHDYFHIIHKSMDHFQGLRDGDPAFLLSETVKPL